MNVIGHFLDRSVDQTQHSLLASLLLLSLILQQLLERARFLNQLFMTALAKAT